MYGCTHVNTGVEVRRGCWVPWVTSHSTWMLGMKLGFSERLPWLLTSGPSLHPLKNNSKHFVMILLTCNWLVSTIRVLNLIQTTENIPSFTKAVKPNWPCLLKIDFNHSNLENFEFTSLLLGSWEFHPCAPLLLSQFLTAPRQGGSYVNLAMTYWSK